MQFFGLPLPGPVIGMVLLFAFLVLRSRFNTLQSELDDGGIPVELAKVSDGLLSSLSLLFVPAGVGVMAHFSLLRNDWLPLSTAVVVSTLLTVVVTALVMSCIQKYFLKENNVVASAFDEEDGHE